MSRQDDIAEPLIKISLYYKIYSIDVIADDVNVSRIDIKYDIKQRETTEIHWINVTSVY